jgi:heme exporter protein C
MWVWFSKLGSPRWFYELSSRWLPWLVALMVILMSVGIVWALLFVPEDYQQGHTCRCALIELLPADGHRRNYYAGLEDEACRYGG